MPVEASAPAAAGKTTAAAGKTTATAGKTDGTAVAGASSTAPADYVRAAEVVALRTTDPAKAAKEAQYSWADAVYTGNVCVFVSDLSGFTSTTRLFGIAHFGSIIIRKRQLAYPILHKYNVKHIAVEADNLIAVFENDADCVKAALESREAIYAYNASLGQTRQHFKINFAGVGVHSAPGMIIDVNGECHGDAYKEAYVVGEDHVEGGEILITQSVLESIQSDSYFAQTEFKKLPNTDGKDLYSVLGAWGRKDFTAFTAPTDDDSFIATPLLQLARRHDPNVDLRSWDKEIERTLMRPLTVLMFKLDIDRGGRIDGLIDPPTLDDWEQLKLRALREFEEAVTEFEGQALEEMLWVFPRITDAVLAAIRVRSIVNSFTGQLAKYAKVSGYGIHYGKMIFIEGTDVHWGDPVNTSSKLGQDLAQGGEILITPLVKLACESDRRCARLSFAVEKLFVSKVWLTCFHVVETA